MYKFHSIALEGRLPATSKRVTITSNHPYEPDLSICVTASEPPLGRSGLTQRSCSKLNGYVFPVLSSPTEWVVP